MERRDLRRHIWGYLVGLCPIERTLDLYDLISVKYKSKSSVIVLLDFSVIMYYEK